MAEIDFFGSRSKMRRIILSNDTDFVLTFRYKVSGVMTDWPAGAAVTWVFDNGTEWDATISGSAAVFNIDHTALNEFTEGMGYKVLYDNGAGGQFKPYRGTVVRDD